GQNRCPAAVAAQPHDGRRRGRGSERRALHLRGRLQARREVPAPLRGGGQDARVLAGVHRHLPGGLRGRVPGRRPAVRRAGEPGMTSTEIITRAEYCAVACAEIFDGAGEIIASPMTPMATLGARLARLTTEPDLLMSDGEALLLADTPPLGGSSPIEGWIPFRKVFDVLASGRRHVVMGANQIDRFGNQNL